MIYKNHKFEKLSRTMRYLLESENETVKDLIFSVACGYISDDSQALEFTEYWYSVVDNSTLNSDYEITKITHEFFGFVDKQMERLLKRRPSGEEFSLYAIVLAKKLFNESLTYN